MIGASITELGISLQVAKDLVWVNANHLRAELSQNAKPRSLESRRSRRKGMPTSVDVRAKNGRIDARKGD